MVQADTSDCKQSIKAAEHGPWEPSCICWPEATKTDVDAFSEFLESELAWDIETKPELHPEALHGSDDCTVGFLRRKTQRIQSVSIRTDVVKLTKIVYQLCVIVCSRQRSMLPCDI